MRSSNILRLIILSVFIFLKTKHAFAYSIHDITNNAPDIFVTNDLYDKPHEKTRIALDDYYYSLDTVITPEAYFSYEGTTEFFFTDLSLNTPTTWFWDFGDGETSDLQNPTHLFTNNGSFNVCLTAGNVAGASTYCDSVSISAYSAPTASFTLEGNPTVIFTDASLNEPTGWFWDFGDGSTSDVQNPIHTYGANGVYLVCLTASNDEGADSFCADAIIDSYITPDVYFSFSGDPSVSFTDASTNTPTSWFWDFGDGENSYLNNPIHTYAENGIFTACLTAGNGGGENTACQEVLIASYIYAPDANFDFSGDPTMTFNDLSFNEPTYWLWDFGDGAVSAIQNPTHTFSNNGTFVVCLTAGNIMGENQECKNIVITGYAAPIANFSFTGDPMVTFSDLSTGGPNFWIWNFGDGSYSADINPEHLYTTNGIYTVCLSVNGPGGTDTQCEEITITQNGSAPGADFTYTLDFPFVYFSDASTNTPSNWFWDFGDGGISGLQNPNHEYTESESYTVCLITSNDFGSGEVCKTIAVFPEAVVTENVSALKIWPSPASHYIQINGLPQDTKTEQVHIIGADGVKHQSHIRLTAQNTWQVHTEPLPAGNYWIVIQEGSTCYFGQFSKL